VNANGKAVVKCGTSAANDKFPQCEGGKVVARPVIAYLIPIHNIYTAKSTLGSRSNSKNRKNLAGYVLL
jgi:hypothetical protein